MTWMTEKYTNITMLNNHIHTITEHTTLLDITKMTNAYKCNEHLLIRNILIINYRHK